MTRACSTVHPTFGRCIRTDHDASNPREPHRYDVGARYPVSKDPRVNADADARVAS